MWNRRAVQTLCGAGILVLVMAASVNALGDARHTAYLRFNTPFALPGVALPSGTYIFELADPGVKMNLVRITSRDRSQVYLVTFTQLVQRPESGVDRQVSFGEVPRGVPPPVTAWYPIGESVGHRFVYPKDSPQLTGRASN
jgi:hypothetical protein